MMLLAQALMFSGPSLHFPLTPEHIAHPGPMLPHVGPYGMILLYHIAASWQSPDHCLG
jgi:hypothetical protein